MARKSLRIAGLALGAAVLLRPAGAEALEVFACEPEWAALATELGGDKVEVFSATTARQDPHQIQARPALIARLRSADLVVCSKNLRGSTVPKAISTPPATRIFRPIHATLRPSLLRWRDG